MVMMASPADGLADHAKASLSDKLACSDSGRGSGSPSRKPSVLDGPTAPITQSHVQGMCSDDEDVAFPLLVKVLVGSKCGIAKWSEISGPACCSLWLEIQEASDEFLAPSSVSGLTGELKLVYRLRGRPALAERLMVGSRARQVLMRKSIQQKLETFFSDLASDCPRKNFQSSEQLRENSVYCLRGKDCCSRGIEGTPLIWQISCDAFHKLINMLAPSGILRSFQEIVLQVVDVSCFFDVPLQQLDLMELTALHPYVIFMIGSDVAVAWQGLPGLSWALLKFDFYDCVILTANGTSLEDLRKYCKAHIAEWTSVGSYLENRQQADSKTFRQNLSCLRWRKWHQTSGCAECAEASALESFLCDLFHRKGRMSAAETAAANSLSNFCPLPRGADKLFHVTPVNTIGTAIWELNTSCLRPTALTTREHHALIQLRSTDSLIRQNNLQFLLDLLRGLVLQKDGGWSAASSTDSVDTVGRQTRSNPATFRSLSHAHNCLPSAEQPHWSPALSDIEFDNQSNVFFSDAKSSISNLLLRGIIGAIRRRSKIFPEPPGGAVMRWAKMGSQTERALQPRKLNWRRPCEMKANLPIRADCFSGSHVHRRSGTWRVLSHWISHGFLEAILEQLKDVDLLSGWVQEAADVCLKVVSCVPGDGSTRLVQCLQLAMQEKIDSFEVAQLKMGLAVVTSLVPQAAYHQYPHYERGETPEDWKQERWLRGIQSILQLLSSVTSENSVIAAGLVQSSGLNLIVKIYNRLVNIGHVNRLKSRKKAKENVDPGETGDQHNTPLRCQPTYTTTAWHGRKSESVDTCDSHRALTGDRTPSKLWESLKKLTESYDGQIKEHTFVSPRQVRKGTVLKDAAQSARLSSSTSLQEDINSQATSVCKSAAQENRGHYRKLAEASSLDAPYLRFPPLTRMDEISYASYLPSTSFINECKGSSYMIPEPMSEPLSEFHAASRVRCTFHNLLCEAKCHVLSTLSSMLSVSSRTVVPPQEATLLHENGALAESLLAELLGGLSCGPACVGVGSQVLVYETIFGLSRLWDTAAQDESHNVKYESYGCSRRFSVVFLELIRKRLLSAINLQKDFVDTRSDNLDKAIDQENPEIRCWIDVGLLLGVLIHFVTQWPERGAALTVFRVCGRQLAMLLDILASSGCPQSRSIAEITAMERLLRFVLTAFYDSVCSSNLSFGKCAETEDFIWQLAAGHPQRWSCIERFADWVLLGACHRCTGNLFRIYQRYIHEPLACHLCENGHAPSMQMEDLASCLYAWKKTVLKFLRVMVALLQRRMSSRRDITQGPVRFPLPETVVWLLEFLMNPINGVLIRMLKGQQAPFSNVITSCEFPWTHSTTEGANVSSCEQSSANTASLQDGNSSRSEGHCPTVTQYKTLQDGGLGTTPRALTTACKECGKILCDNKSLTQDFLCLLSDVFGLKISARIQNNSILPVHDGDMERNPFLTSKYVEPFLDTVFRCFLQLYNTGMHAGNQTDHTSTPRMIPLQVKCASSFDTRGGSKRLSNQMPACVKSGFNGPAGSKFSRITEQEAVLTSESYKDEAISHLCKLHAGVLLTLAQNQSEDVRKRFRQLKVMDFLIEQISLEYEACHFVTPRQGSGAHDNVQRPNFSDSDALQTEQSGFSEKAARFWPEKNQNGVLEQEICSVPVPMVKPQTNSSLRATLEPFSTKAKGNLNTFKRRQLSSVSIPQLKLDQIPRDTGNSFDRDDAFNNTANLKGIVQPENQELLPAEIASRPHSQRGYSETHSSPESCSSAKELGGLDKNEDQLDPARSLKGNCGSLDKSKYSGRFCDFNEEVDHQLAEEAVTGSLDEGEDADRPEQDEDSMSSTFVSSHNAIHTKPGEGSHSNQTRPPVPKLNLPKSVRKDWTSRAEPTIIAPLAQDTVAPASASSERCFSGSNSICGATDSCAHTSTFSYESGRMRRRIYSNADLHVLLLELVISLMLTP